MSSHSWEAGPIVSRRRAVGLAIAGVASAVAACRGASGPAVDARLRSRPGTPFLGIAPGEHDLELSSGTRDGKLYVPSSYQPGVAAPLVVSLHGAGRNAAEGLGIFRGFADQHALIVLAPDSRAQSWDVVRGGFGPDVSFIDGALQFTFDRCLIDPARIAIGGFSDGASYALSLGLSNGDLFGRIVAYSPGFMAPAGRRGSPRIFVSHGTRDTILPIDYTSRRIVPRLEQWGYAVQYREFDGTHELPLSVAREATTWMLSA